MRCTAYVRNGRPRRDAGTALREREWASLEAIAASCMVPPTDSFVLPWQDSDSLCVSAQNTEV